MKIKILLCLLLIAAALLISCGNTEVAAPETASESAVESEKHATELPATDPPETEPPVTRPPETEPPVPGEVETLDVKWRRGYVASDMNFDASSDIVEGSNFSYTEVFTVERAGTVIKFRDTPSGGSGSDGLASNTVYVFSFWKKNASGTWVLDKDARHYRGPNNLASVISEPAGDDVMIYTYVTSRDNENIRLCYRSGEGSGDSKMRYPVVKTQFTGETPTDVLYDREMQELNSWIESTKSAAWYDILEGKTVNIIGDSYFAGNGLDKNYLWPSLLAAKYGIDLVNHGINGATVCVTDDNKHPIVNRYKNLPDNDPDIVIVEGGRNDYSQYRDGKSDGLGEVNTTDARTYKGALTVIIRGLKEKYPNAMIMCVTPWAAADDIIYYGAAMKEVAAYEGVPCFNALDRNLTKVDMASANFRANYCMKPTDTSHLNAEGMKRVMPAFEKFIAEEYAAFVSK